MWPWRTVRTVVPRGCWGGGGRGRRVARRRVVRRRGVEREAGGVPKVGDSSSAGGSIRHPKKDFQDVFISILEAKINK